MSQPCSSRNTALLGALLFGALVAPIAPVAFAQAPVATAATRAETPYLSQADAAARSARVSNVAYTLDFALTGEPTFKATSKIDFDLKDNASPLTIDLDKAKVGTVIV